MTLVPKSIYYPKKLDGYISEFSYYEVEENESPGRFMLPLGTVQIVFQTEGNISHNTTFTPTWESRPKVFIGGPYDAGYQMKFKGKVSIFSLVFKVGKFKYFSSDGTNQLTNSLFLLEDIWGWKGKVLVDKVLTSHDNNERVHILESFLLNHLRPVNQTPIEKAISELFAKKGNTSITALRYDSGFSKTHFLRRFKEDVGLNPKQLRKIIRINALISFYLQNNNLSLTELSYYFNYFDQSHFIKDFKSVTGCPPKKFFNFYKH